MSHDDGKTTIHATMNKERNDVKMYRDFSALLALLLLDFAPFLKLLCLHMRTVSTSSSMYVQATNELNASVVKACAKCQEMQCKVRGGTRLAWYLLAT